MNPVMSKPFRSISFLILCNILAQISSFANVNELGDKETGVQRGCLPLNECDYYRMLLGNNIAGLSKEAIKNEIEQHTCDIHEENQKGNFIIFYIK